MDSQEFDDLLRGKNINFLIGSGASVPMYPTLKLSDNYSFEDLVSNQELSESAKRYVYAYYFKRWIKAMSISPKLYSENTEEDKTGKSEVINNYFKFVELLCKFLYCESNEKPKRINIFTTNYDLMFEYSFDEILERMSLVYFNDGSRGFLEKYINNNNFYLNVSHSGYNDNFKREVPTINLFKMHGSLSWELEGEKIKVTNACNTVQEADDILEQIKIIWGDVEENILGLINEQSLEDTIQQLNDFMDNKDSETCDLLNEFYDKYRDIPIINPDKYKFSRTVSEQHYYQLIRDFSYELEKEETVLVVFGFSFADEHIQDIFERSLLNPKLLVIVISYSEMAQNLMKEKFEKYNNVIFIPEKWEYDSNGDCVEKGDLNYLLKMMGDTDD